MIYLDEWQKEVLKTEGNLVICSGRQIGKSTIVAIKAADYALKNEKKKVLVVSATERQADELFLKILMFVESLNKFQILGGKNRPTKHMLKLKNGSIIRSLPCGANGDGIRGYTTDLLICDEAAYIPETVFLAITPQLLTTGGKMILLSTPKGKKTSDGQNTYFYNAFLNKNHRFSVFHINSEEVINNRPISDSWTENQKKAALELLESEKRSMTKLQYAQEYLGQFVEDVSQWFSDELIDRCCKGKRPHEIDHNFNLYLGVDVARQGKDECVFTVVMKKSKTEYIQIENIIIKKIYLNDVTKKIIELDRVYNFKQIFIDSGGIGVGVSDYLLDNDQTKRKTIEINNRSRAVDYEGVHKRKILKEDLYTNLLNLMERGEILLLDDDEIRASLKSIQAEFDNSEGRITDLKIYGNYSHCVEALIRAAYCSKDKRLNIWIR